MSNDNDNDFDFKDMKFTNIVEVLATWDEIDYELRRKRIAEDLKVRPCFLDKMINKYKKNNDYFI